MNEVTLQQSTQLQAMSPEQVNSALKVVFPNLLQNEYELGMKVACEFGLNPLKREIYLVGYGQGTGRKLSVIIGYEVFLKRAERIGTLDGWKCETLSDCDGNPIAKCEIWRKDRKMPFVWEVSLDEYKQENQMWKSKPRTMLKKVCIAQAFRLCFPEELGGMPYTADELPTHMAPAPVSADVVTDVPPQAQSKPKLSPEEAKQAISEIIAYARELHLSDENITDILGRDDWDQMNGAQYNKLKAEINRVETLLSNGGKQ